jgi:hypothetical protein
MASTHYKEGLRLVTYLTTLANTMDKEREETHSAYLWRKNPDHDVMKYLVNSC